VTRSEAARAPAGERLIDAYSAALLQQAECRPELTVLDADLAHELGLSEFKRRHPARFVECGSAEMDMVSQAGGMALRGLLPICHSFACFLSARSNEQIYNNAGERTKVLYVAALAGLLPAGPGHSHQGVRDIAALSGVPGLCMVAPSSARDVGILLEHCLEVHEGSAYLRLCSLPWQLPYEQPAAQRLSPGRGVSVRGGSDGVIVAYGPVMLTQAYLVAERLARRGGVELEVVDLPWLNQLDTAWFEGLMAARRWLFCLDDHYLAGGQGQMLCSALAESGLGWVRAQRFGVSGLPACGSPNDVLRHHGLDVDSLVSRIQRRLHEPLHEIPSQIAGHEPLHTVMLRQARGL
jgi:transketolase